MTCYAGKDGVVKVGAAGSEVALGSVRSFSIDETAETLDCTVMGDTFREYSVSYKAWAGTVDVLWNPDDAGQNGVTVGSSLSFLLYPEGASTGDVEYSGTGIVTGITRTATYDGLVEQSVTFQGSGTLTKDTV
jgi:hypothetical protein